jgi:hypothetical protein
MPPCLTLRDWYEGGKSSCSDRAHSMPCLSHARRNREEAAGTWNPRQIPEIPSMISTNGVRSEHQAAIDLCHRLGRDIAWKRRW